VSDESSEGCAVGQQDGKVIKSEQSSTWNRPRSSQLMQSNYLVIVTMRAEADGVAITTDDVQPENIFIELHRSFEIGDLQSYSAEVRRFGKTIATRTKAPLLGGWRGNAIGHESLRPIHAAIATPLRRRALARTS
jgi:hypothetical protein